MGNGFVFEADLQTLEHISHWILQVSARGILQIAYMDIILWQDKPTITLIPLLFPFLLIQGTACVLNDSS